MGGPSEGDTLAAVATATGAVLVQGWVAGRPYFFCNVLSYTPPAAPSVRSGQLRSGTAAAAGNAVRLLSSRGVPVFLSPKRHLWPFPEEMVPAATCTDHHHL